MGIRVSSKPNWGKYIKRIKKADEKLFSLAEGLIVGIQKRTQSGVDKNKKGFKGYSKNYKKTGKVDLTDTNDMLHGIDRKKIKGGIKLYFSNANENRKAHGNQVKYGRKFFGLDKEQKILMKRRLGKYIVKTTR